MTLNSLRAGQDPEYVPAEAPRILAGFLVSYADPRGMFWPIFQGRNLIGRRGAPQLTVAFDDPTISAHHAVILAAACPGRLKLEDQGSTNGTLVGKLRLQPGQRRELNDGDTIRFGAMSTIVKIII